MQQLRTAFLGAILAAWTNCQGADAPAIEWQRSFGGSVFNECRSVVQNSDGGFVFAGTSYSSVDGQNYFHLISCDSLGSVLWEHFYTAGGGDLSSMDLTRDGGIVLGGSTSRGATGDKTSPNFGKNDYWLLRLDGDGNKLWDRSFGGTNDDYLSSVQQTADGGFILGGISNSGADGNKSSTNHSAQFDFWIIRLDSNGDKIWDRSYGGTGSDFCTVVQQTPDGGFIAGGTSSSKADGDKSSPWFEGQLLVDDCWIVRLDADGNKLWDRTFGGNGMDQLAMLRQTSDGGLVFGGPSYLSTNGNKTAQAFGSDDFWVVRLDSDGNKLWDRSFGGSGRDFVHDIVQTSDAGFIVGGYSDSLPGGNKVSQNFGAQDMWVVRLDPDGNKIWEGSFGGSGNDSLWSLRQTIDGGIIMVGWSVSNPSGNKTSPHFGANGWKDFWIVKLAPELPHLRLAHQSPADVQTEGFRFLLSGLPNHSYVTEFTSDWTCWTPLQTNQIAGSEVEISDADATNAPNRFYRTRELTSAEARLR